MKMTGHLSNSDKTIIRLSRRSFITKTLATACAFSAAPAYAGQKDTVDKSKKLPLKMAGYELDRVAGLVDGRVKVSGCDASFELAGVGDMNTDVFSGGQTRDVTEIGLHPYMLAYANEGFRDYSLLPVFPLRVFRHKSIFINTNSGIKNPEDLRGRKVATPGFSSSSLTWLRGIIQHEYGVRPEEIEWVVSSKDSSAGVAGKVSKQESMIPDGLNVTKGPVGKDESDLLVDGDVDALFHAAEPRAYTQGHPDVARLFSDYRQTERAYYKKTGIFPIMHAVAIRNSLAEKNPWLPEAVFNAYSQAKQLMYNDLRKTGWATISLPWVGKELEETRALMGDNFWPYGIDANRKALETLFQYSYEQGLASRKLKIEDLFHPSTLDLKEV
jgi:4,5-dihydroxyphthalate decarboxylase